MIDREMILAATAELLRRHGHAKTGVVDVARLAAVCELVLAALRP